MFTPKQYRRNVCNPHIWTRIIYSEPQNKSSLWKL